MKTCYIFGAADGLPDRFKKNEEDLVIAADSGINHLEKFGALPDIAVGDFVFGGLFFLQTKGLKYAECYSGASAEPCQITSSVPFLTLTVAGLPVNSLLTPNGKS